MSIKQRIEKLEQTTPEHKRQLQNWGAMLYGAAPVYGPATPCRPFVELGRASQ